MRRESLTLDCPVAGNGTGSASHVANLEGMWCQVSGTFTATVAVEVSLDGTNYVAIGNVTAPGLIEVPQPASAVRIVVSGWGAGQAAAVLAGRNSRTE
jgi:hypothetical protein